MLTESFADGLLKYKALLGLDTLNTHDDSVFRANLKTRFSQAFDAYAWPDFCVFGELVSLTSNFITTNDSQPATGAYLSTWADNVLRVHKQDPSTNLNTGDYIYQIDRDPYGSTAVKIINSTSLSGTNVYVSYKKDLDTLIKSLVTPEGTTGFFGSAVLIGGDTDVIPSCVYDYVIYGAYVDHLKADGQNQKAILEEQFADKILQDSINKIENTGRQFRHKIVSERPRSQFARHGFSQSSQVVLPGQGGSQ